MTDEIEASATDYIRQIDQMGGAPAAIERGFQQSEIQDAAYHTQLAQERGEQIVVGVNKFQTEMPPPVGLLRVDQAIEAEQIERLRHFKASRASAPIAQARAALKAAALGSDNLMPHILKAVREKVTLGEISDTLRDVFGEYVEQVAF